MEGKLATSKQIKYLKKYKCNFKHIEKHRDLLDKLINQKFDTWKSQDAWLIISELECIRNIQYSDNRSWNRGPLFLDPEILDAEF